MLEVLIIEAAVRTLRAVAFATGALVAVDPMAIILLPQERPPHRPRLNAVAWLVAGLGTMIAAGWILAATYGQHATGAAPRLSIALLWGTLATAFTIRAATRAWRPWMIVGSSLLFAGAGIGFSVADKLIA